MRILFFTAFSAWALISFTGCAGKEVRTKWTDKTMRVMIDPESIDAEHYVKISSALVRSGRFIVVDRSNGFAAIKKEQERLHQADTDRFADREKYAHWGKMYGVGGVVVAHAQCHQREGFLSGRFQRCNQSLAIIDSNTGEVISVSEGQEDGQSGYQTPSWDDVVAKLESAYPKHFEKDETSARLEEYKQLSKEEATRTKEARAKEEIIAEKKAAERKPASEEQSNEEAE